MNSKKLRILGYMVVLSFCGLITSCLSSTSTTPTPNTNPPAVPNGVVVTGSTITTISVSWNAVAGATSYTVYYTVDGTAPSSDNNSDSFDINSTTSLTFTPTSDAFGLPINISVTASNDNGEGNPSAFVTGATLVPKNVVATSLGSGTLKMQVTWTAVPGALTYNVYHTFHASASAAGPTEQTYGNESEGVNSTTYTWTASAADVGDYYHFAISAVNAAGEGGLSADVVVQAE